MTVPVQPLASVTVYIVDPTDCVKVPVPVYGAVPPVALMVTVDVPPLHAISVWVSVAVITAGSVRVTVTVPVQPLASVTVYVVDPTDCVKVPVPVYGAVPPVALMVTVDVPPLHAISVWVSVAVITAGSVRVTVTVPVQPLASVTVYVVDPTDCVKVPVPVYGAVPPVALMVTVDVPPLHAISVWVSAAVIAAGSVRVTVTVPVQPLGHR